MAIDVSKVRLNPFLDFAGVELKQGGVLIDADLNELTGIIDRRLRALASDVLGRATVSSTTPDAFKIGISGTTLSIGKGRLYVDGLLAENHGAVSTDNAKRMFDPLLAEAQFTDAILYPTQPYLPNPPALPTAGRHLVYLDVWNREVTHLEDPNLVESAIGVEATSRIQTVWQVRTLGDDAGAGTTCATPDADVPGWSSTIAASTGALTVGEHQVAAVDDPCELPPTGGYRGLENQLYRVEIHDGGQPGAGASFKWSRENASVGSRVTSIISATEFELATLGRDDVLSIKTGDWVEIIDDVREFAQRPGELRKITVDPATRRVTVAALPADMLPGTFPNTQFPKLRHMRVRRWDQGGKIFRTNGNSPPVEIIDPAAANGLISVPASNITLILEHGVTVNFASTGAKGFKPGDYWVFAARTADASVEKFNRAPPRGIHHHYARLGLWDVAAGTVTDCRHPWPPEAGEGHDCSCTACVTQASHADGSFTIQDAVNQASQTGGTVCIGPGQFALAEPVRLTNTRALRIRGQGAATAIFAAGCAFALKNCIAVTIENLAVLSLGSQPAVSVNSALALKLRELMIAVLNVTGDVRGAAIALQGVVAAAEIADNGIFASFGVKANDASAPHDEGEADEPFLLTGALRICDNIFWCDRQAVVLDGRVLHIADTRITGNDALACRQAAISTLGIGLRQSAAYINQNALYIEQGGIRSSLDGLWVCENKVVSTERREGAVGVAVSPGLFKAGVDQCQILGNQIQGFAEAGIVVEAPVRDLIVKLNIIADCGNGILALGATPIDALSIENNHLRDIGVSANEPGRTVIGIGAARARSAAIAGNTIQSLGMQAVQSPLRAGIFALGVERTRISGNEIVALAPTADFIGPAIGILLLTTLADFQVEHNRAERDASFPQNGGIGPWTALAARDASELGPTKFGAFAAIGLVRAPRLLFAGNRAFLATVAEAAGGGPNVRGSIVGNVLVSRSDAPAVESETVELLFSDNRVDAIQNGKVAIILDSRVTIVNANRVRGGEVSIELRSTDAKSTTVLGNITTGAIVLPGGLSDPWDKLNLRA